jgi:hypothetical protein
MYSFLAIYGNSFNFLPTVRGTCDRRLEIFSQGCNERGFVIAFGWTLAADINDWGFMYRTVCEANCAAWKLL